MNQNVIILTSGLTGSSVLAALISRAGYWAGGSTHRKQSYDTYENEDLIKLNLQLFEKADYSGNYLLEFSGDAAQRIGALYETIDIQPYKSFVTKCMEKQPWIWKEPRLWLTIRFWGHLVDLRKCKFIVLTRSNVQLWVSATLRGQIRTYRHSRTYEEQILRSIIEFLREKDLSYVPLQYEQLIQNPVGSIKTLNSFLQTKLTVDDLRHVYQKPLYKNPRNSITNHCKAALIYAKNYSERLDVRSKEIDPGRPKPSRPEATYLQK